MALTKSCYVLTLFIQHIFIFVDIVCNSISDKVNVRKHSTALFVIFIIQDAFLLMAVTCLCFSLFKTNVFKAGFLELLLYRFKGVIIFAVFYVVSTIALQTFLLLFKWENPLDYNWPTLLNILYALQRLLAVFYYYFYKRSAMRLSDHRYYDEEWVKHALSHQTGT